VSSTNSSGVTYSPIVDARGDEEGKVTLHIVDREAERVADDGAVYTRRGERAQLELGFLSLDRGFLGVAIAGGDGGLDLRDDLLGVFGGGDALSEFGASALERDCGGAVRIQVDHGAQIPRADVVIGALIRRCLGRLAAFLGLDRPASGGDFIESEQLRLELLLGVSGGRRCARRARTARRVSCVRFSRAARATGGADGDNRPERQSGEYPCFQSEPP
jgi:hypothetical protein